MENQPLIAERLYSDAVVSDFPSGAIEECLGSRSISIREWIKLIAWESRLLWKLSWASIVVSLFTYLLTFATLMFTGHLGTLELAGASLASVGIHGLAYGIMVSFLSS